MWRAPRGGTVGATMSTPAAAVLNRPARARAWREVAIDVTLTAVAAAITLATIGNADGPLGRDAILLALVGTVPLLLWRRAPLTVFAITAAASAGIDYEGYDLGIGVAPTVMVFLLARLAPEARRAATTPVIVLLFLAQVGADRLDATWSPLPIPLLIWVFVWRAGEIVRERRERAVAREEDAERARDLAVAQERTRIARDLHDSAGHAINVILVQAGAARLLSRQDPERSQAALETIEEVARETLGEIDQLVRALRDDDAPNGAAAKVEPPTGLAAVKTLAERHRSAGLAVEVHERGSRRPLSPGLDQAAYRILQEALTNAARHGAGSAVVGIVFAPTSLELTVTNPTGPGTSPGADGHGIVGMRERAALLGGTLEAGASDGRFRIRARLPYDAEGT
jgi:signal transduction histidine kinase